MWNIFESFWLLLTLAGISLIVVSIIRNAGSNYGYKLYLIPIVLAGLAFGLDYAVQTDYEAIVHIINTSKKAAVEGDYKTISDFLSPNYSDAVHRDKASMSAFMNTAVAWASLKKIRVQAHSVAPDLTSSQLSIVVHLNNNKDNPVGGGLFFVTLKFQYEKIGKDMYIKRADLVTVNNSRMNWGSVP